jgi:putative membrane protein
MDALIGRPLRHHCIETHVALAMPAMLPSTRKLTLWGLDLILIANVLVALVAALHAYFLILEMFLWDKPQGLKVFRNTPEKAEITKVLAANQGLYNGFLVAGLIWGLVHGNPAFAFQIKAFFLICVIVAGAYGAATVSTRILIVQALPAAVALVVLYLA